MGVSSDTFPFQATMERSWVYSEALSIEHHMLSRGKSLKERIFVLFLPVDSHIDHIIGKL